MTTPLPKWNGPILDNHFHLNRKGRYLDAAKDFKNQGGTHLVLVHCPDFSSPPTHIDEHRSTYAGLLALMLPFVQEVLADLSDTLVVGVGAHVC